MFNSKAIANGEEEEVKTVNLSLWGESKRGDDDDGKNLPRRSEIALIGSAREYKSAVLTR